jgi:hypothetical protein
MRSANDVLADRELQYADTWRLSGDILRLAHTFSKGAGIWSTIYSGLWTRILVKWVRIMWEPDNVDHWIDLRNYAELAIRDLTEVIDGSR